MISKSRLERSLDVHASTSGRCSWHSPSTPVFSRCVPGYAALSSVQVFKAHGFASCLVLSYVSGRLLRKCGLQQKEHSGMLPKLTDSGV